MANRLLILSAAERDISEAFAWYESHQSGLGFEFLRAVFHTAQDPQKWRDRLP